MNTRIKELDVYKRQIRQYDIINIDIFGKGA